MFKLGEEALMEECILIETILQNMESKQKSLLSFYS